MLTRIRKKKEAFRTAQAFILPTCAPGPGAYSPETVDKSTTPAFSIGKSKRYEVGGKNCVGPGSYSPCIRNSFKSAVFGTSPKKCLEILSTTPGPGRYDSGKTETGPGFSIRGKREELQMNPNPGPGQYDPEHHFENQGFKFPQEKKTTFVITNKSPGPANYNIPRSNSSKGVIFSKQSRTLSRYDQSPGPGSYNTIISSGSPKASMKFRHKIKLEERSPGPAQYEPQVIKEKRPSVKIGKSKRFIEIDELLPGPGSYGTIGARSSSAIFGTSRKECMFKGNDLPGPGEYKYRNTIGEGPSYTMSNKKPFIKPNLSPGPGSYHVVKNETVKGVVFGKSKSRDFIKVYNETGPADYNVSSIKDHNGWSFSTESRWFDISKIINK